MKTIALIFLRHCGRYSLMIWQTIRSFSLKTVEFKEICKQIVLAGNNSLPIVLLTALFTGMVLALQTAYGLERFGAKNYVGNITSMAFVRELGPVLTAIVLCGRVGAGVAAELASMKVTQQIDAMRALGANPLVKLVAPRIIAGTVAMPLLVIFADLIGMYGGLLIALYELDISKQLYYDSIMYTLVIRDVTDGLIKSACFGFLCVSLACYKGLQVRGGTEGVGAATTSAVVTGCIVIFIADFFLTKLLLMIP